MDHSLARRACLEPTLGRVTAVRCERIEFQILRHIARGYVATRPSGGWRKSAVFGKAFRLTRQLDDLGHPDFTLDVK